MGIKVFAKKAQRLAQNGTNQIKSTTHNTLDRLRHPSDTGFRHKLGSLMRNNQAPQTPQASTSYAPMPTTDANTHVDAHIDTQQIEQKINKRAKKRQEEANARAQKAHLQNQQATHEAWRPVEGDLYHATTLTEENLANHNVQHNQSSITVEDEDASSHTVDSAELSAELDAMEQPEEAYRTEVKAEVKAILHAQVGGARTKPSGDTLSTGSASIAESLGSDLDAELNAEIDAEVDAVLEQIENGDMFNDAAIISDSTDSSEKVPSSVERAMLNPEWNELGASNDNPLTFDDAIALAEQDLDLPDTPQSIPPTNFFASSNSPKLNYEEDLEAIKANIAKGLDGDNIQIDTESDSNYDLDLEDLEAGIAKEDALKSAQKTPEDTITAKQILQDAEKKWVHIEAQFGLSKVEMPLVEMPSAEVRDNIHDNLQSIKQQQEKLVLSADKRTKLNHAELLEKLSALPAKSLIRARDEDIHNDAISPPLKKQRKEHMQDVHNQNTSDSKLDAIAKNVEDSLVGIDNKIEAFKEKAKLFKQEQAALKSDSNTLSGSPTDSMDNFVTANQFFSDEDMSQPVNRPYNIEVENKQQVALRASLHMVAAKKK